MSRSFSDVSISRWFFQVIVVATAGKVIVSLIIEEVFLYS